MGSRQRRGFCLRLTLASRGRLAGKRTHHICGRATKGGSKQHPAPTKKKGTVEKDRRGGDEWRLFCVAKKSFAYALVSKLPRLRLACAPHLQQSCKRWFETTLIAAKIKGQAQDLSFYFGGDEWIRTTAPVIPTYTLSRGASSANLSTSP